VSEDINKKIDRVLSDMRAPFPSKEASWDRLMNRIEVKEVTENGRSLKYTYVAAAASVLFILGLLFFLDNDLERVSTELAEHRTVELPDGSTVHLNAGSYIEFDEDEFNKSRKINLDGEAFFKVEKGSSFDVITDQGVVRVLGTSFNVCDRADFFEVTCETGKVRVSHEGREVILTPGLATHNKKGTLAPAFSANEASDWMRGSFDFEDESLEFVFEVIERQFAVDVKSIGLEQRSFTGEFDSSDLETALTVICQPMGLEYQIKDNSEIVITLK
jgi:ferric-dicitrate binding protein FerR (iron transport regulator)